jgi:cytidine deaminase
MNWKELEKRAYIPYSRKAKACVIKGSSGSFYPGVRIENVSFPITIPAVQAACSFCLANGDTPQAIILKDDHPLEQQDYWVKEFNLNIIVQSDIDNIEF